MGSLTFDFLKPSVLLSPSDIEEKYRRLTDDELRDELRRYRAYCQEHEADLRLEIPSEPRTLTVFSGQNAPPLTSLKQDALYVDAHIIDDPIFKHTYEPSEVRKHAAMATGARPDILDRSAIANAARYMNALTPCVAANYVKFLPVSRHFEPPPDLKINLPRNQYEGILPRDLLDFFQTNAIAVSMTRAAANGPWLIQDELSLSRGILIAFQDHPSEQSAIYHLFKPEILKLDESTHIATAIMTLSDDPPEQAEFDLWVRQSINSASRDFFDHTVLELGYAEQTNATYLTASPFVDRLLEFIGQRPEGITASTARAIAEFELPVVQNVGLDTLMRVRQEESPAFANLRIEFERRFREIRLEQDPAKIAKMVQNAYHEITTAQVHEANVALRKAKRGVLADILLAAGALATSIITTPAITLVTIAIAGVHGYKIFETVRETKAKPAYLFRRLIRETRAG